MKNNKSDQGWRQKSLEELENDKWPDEKEYPTGLIKRCHEFRKIPVGKLTIEQLRTLIGQDIGLRHLIPIAIEFLTTDVLSEGDFYPGDLLMSLINLDNSFWSENTALKKQLAELINSNLDKLRNEELDLDKWQELNSAN
jgi:hypothetical protein